jgi:hypothetical protein
VADFVAAIDQGTTSTRCMIFDHAGAEVGRHQLEHEQILPRAGWVEHNPVEIWERTAAVVMTALNKTTLTAANLAGLGITNQRETTLVWNKRTGRPYHNAIVWQDTRTDRIASALDRDGRGDVIRRKAGLPPATYFSGGKIQWILENVDGVRADAENGDAIFGTPDSWVVWNLTGGYRGGVHVTDVTNASRTMLMNLETLDWDDELLSFFGIPRQMLPEIRPSSSAVPYGLTRPDGPLAGEVPVTGILGDQQAAMVGQVCLDAGEAKNTYGTGNFLLLNTGEKMVRSSNGLLTTVCYQFGDSKPVYALEGSIAVTGSGSGRTPTICGPTGRKANAGARSGARTSAQAATPVGRKPFSAHWIGSTSTESPRQRAGRQQTLELVVVLHAQHGVATLVACPLRVCDLAGQITYPCGVFGGLARSHLLGLLADRPGPVAEVADRRALVGGERRQDQTGTRPAGLQQGLGLATALACCVRQCHRDCDDDDSRCCGRHREPLDAGFGIGNSPAPHHVRDDCGCHRQHCQ